MLNCSLVVYALFTVPHAKPFSALLVSAAFLSSFIDNEIALNRKRGIFKKMYDFLPVEDSSTIELVRARVSVVLSVLVVWGV